MLVLFTQGSIKRGKPMRKVVIAAAAVLAMSSVAFAQQNQTPGASKAGTTQNADENAKMQKGTTGQSSTPGSGSGSSIKSKNNEPQAVPPSNTTGGGAAK